METQWFIPWKRVHEKKKKGGKFSYGKNDITKSVKKEGKIKWR